MEQGTSEPIDEKLTMNFIGSIKLKGKTGR
jgi:hypothetical protein